jgi:CDP-diacylglycerol--glycerol-3-phosphate 3-phosphatidyltransferase
LFQYRVTNFNYRTGMRLDSVTDMNAKLLLRLVGVESLSMSVASKIPLILTSLRALLAPVVVVFAVTAPSRIAFGICLVVGFLSDVFDGVIARKLGIATPNLRRFDSIADTLFYLAVTFAVWHLYPQVIAEHWAALVLLGVLELSRYAFDIAKFRREASYHMWSSKAWGLVLFVACFGLLALGYTGAWVAAPIYVGIVADLEGLAISCILPEWKSDVPSIVHAIKSRAAPSYAVTSDPRPVRRVTELGR